MNRARAWSLLAALGVTPLLAQTAPDTELSEQFVRCSAQVSMFLQAYEQQKQLSQADALRLKDTPQRYLTAGAALSSEQQAQQSLRQSSYREIVTLRVSTRDGELANYLKLLRERVQRCAGLYESNQAYLSPRLEAYSKLPRAC